MGSRNHEVINRSSDMRNGKLEVRNGSQVNMDQDVTNHNVWSKIAKKGYITVTL